MEVRQWGYVLHSLSRIHALQGGNINLTLPYTHSQQRVDTQLAIL
jgi:hypothetical protein